MNKNNPRTFAFTLAEVLVTLMIIGVVSALTIPQLIQNSKNAGTVARLQKTYSSLLNAFNLLITDGKDIREVLIGSQDYQKIYDAFGPKLNVVKYCANGQGCFPDVDYKYLNEIVEENFDQKSNVAKAILSDGTLLWFYDQNGTCSAGSDCGYIVVDINGFNGPNQEGRDTFWFSIKTTGIYPFDGNGCDDVTDWGTACAQRVLSENAVNY